jgi:plastocyanin
MHGMNSKVRAMLLIGLVAVAAAVLPNAASAGKATKVQVGNGFYGPADVTIKKGAKVRWNWDGGFELHDVNVKSGPARFHSPTQATGTFSHKFSKPGKYVLYCTQHEGMTMKVTVKKR